MHLPNERASFSDITMLVLLLFLSSSSRGSAEFVKFRQLQGNSENRISPKVTLPNHRFRPTEETSINTRQLRQFQQPAPQLDAFGRPLYLNDPRQQPNQFGDQFQQPVSGIQFDPVTGRAFVIDPSSGQRIFVDPNTGQPIQQTPSVQFDAVIGQYFVIDPITGQRIFVDPRTGQPIDNQGISQGNGFLDPPTTDGGFFPPPIQNPIQQTPEEPREGVRLQFDTLLRKTFVADPTTGQQLFIGFEPGEASVKVHLPSGLTYVIEPASGRVIPLQMRVDPRVLDAVRGVLTGGRSPSSM